MDLELTQITLLVLFALAGGLIFSWIKQPPILGYILCGMVLGPSGFSFISSRETVQFLSELGIIFLMFVVGFELHLNKLKNIWKIALGCSLGQILISFVVMYAFSFYFKWSMIYTVLIGFIVALSSTSAIIKILETLGQTESENGQRTIAVLIAQDLALIPMIMVLESMAHGHFSAEIFLKIIFSFVLIIGLILFLTTTENISLPLSRVVFRDKELVTLTSFAFCVAAAWGASQIGLSQPLGAFLAGLFLGNTEQRKILLNTIKPVQTLLLMMFFFSIGSLIDFQYVLQHIWTFIFLLLIVTVGKSMANIAILRLLKLSWSDALIVGILLAQIGEFAFLLVGKAKSLKILLGEEEMQIISLTVLSLSFSPVWIKIIKKMRVTTGVNIVSFKALITYLLEDNLLRYYSKCKSFFCFKKKKPDPLIKNEKNI